MQIRTANLETEKSEHYHEFRDLRFLARWGNWLAMAFNGLGWVARKRRDSKET
jgi:hypothetical protein